MAFLLNASAQDYLGRKALGVSHQYRTENENYRFIDTTFSLDQYLQLTFSEKDEFGLLNLGNLGTPMMALKFDLPITARSSLGMNPFENNRISGSDIKYFIVTAPLTETKYLSGYGRGQVFRIFHTQNIHERWNYNLHFQRLNSSGNFNNQGKERSNFYISTQYSSPEKRYFLQAFFSSQLQLSGENGGIIGDTLESNAFGNNRELTPVKFRSTNTSPSYASARFREFKALQTYFLGNMSKPKDSTETPKFQPRFGLSWEFDYRRETYTYRYIRLVEHDFYENFFQNQALTRDSTTYESVRNYVYLHTPYNEYLNFKAGASHEIGYYEGEHFGRYFNQYQLNGEFQFTYKDRIKLFATWDFNFAADALGSQALHLQALWQWKDYIRLKAGLQNANQTPHWMHQFWYSNHYQWFNELATQKTSKLYGSATFKYLGTIELNLWNLNDYIYFDNHAQVAQNTDNIQLVQASWDFHQKIWKTWALENRFLFQATSTPEVIRVPNVLNRTHTYITFNMFKKQLKVMPGVGFQYFTPFSALAYNPASAQFHLQDRVSVGGFPMLDGFVQFELKKVFIFFKYENVGQGIITENYFAAASYPLPDRVLRVGLIWRFFN